jgi:hypothetical protein
VALLLLGSCGSFSEASFDLAPSSRLPIWLQLPAGLKRNQVTVTLDYYASPLSRTASFSLYDSHKRQLRKVSGSQRGDGPLTLKNSSQGYPSYEVITIDGLADVVEHRAMEPTFYMTDDPAVREELKVPANPRLERP